MAQSPILEPSTWGRKRHESQNASPFREGFPAFEPDSTSPHRQASAATPLLIVCEGEVTEPAYFEELRNRLPPEMVERIVLQGVGRGTTQLLKETEALVERRKYDNKPPYYYV